MQECAKHITYYQRKTCYLLFEDYLQEKHFFFHILKLCREIGTLKYFERIFKQFELINWTFTIMM